jgi:uncharacterized protein
VDEVPSLGGGQAPTPLPRGEARFAAGLDDHVFLIRALLSLFEVGAGTDYLRWALELVEIVEKEFKAPSGAYFQTPEDRYLLIRKCEFYDGAEPSGNAVHTENLLRLYQLTQEPKYLERAETLLKGAKHFIETFPPGACYHLIALQRYLDQEAPIVVVAFDENRTHEEELKRLLGGVFSPHAFFVFKSFEDKGLDALVPSLASQGCLEGKTTVHICRGNACQPPMVDLDRILEAVENL